MFHPAAAKQRAMIVDRLVAFMKAKPGAAFFIEELARETGISIEGVRSALCRDRHRFDALREEGTGRTGRRRFRWRLRSGDAEKYEELKRLVGTFAEAIGGAMDRFLDDLKSLEGRYRA